ncbi:MAG: MATE family efflux transporter, partial [Clostridia bacterium]|nr:MATE family efflux transporter [Clostridia bacterium]
MAKQRLDMCNGPLLGKMISYTIPVILTGVLQLLFNAADLIVVGHFCGNNSVAAVGATSALTNLIVNLFVGLSVGAGVAVAQAIGAKDDETVEKTVHTVIPIAIIGGIVLTAVGVGLSKTFLIMMETPADILGLSTSYMQIYFGGIIFTMLYNYGAAILRAAGDTKSPLVYLTIAGVLNVILNYIFVITTSLDVAGVALATTISQALSATLVLITLAKREDACRLDFRKMRIYKTPLLKVIKIGLPAGIQGSIFSISNVLIQSSVNSFDSIALVSGNSAAHNIEGFVWMSVNAFHQTALNFTGQNYGAGQFKRIKKIAAISLACVALTGLALGAVAITFSRQLLSFYISDSPEAISWGVVRMSIICLTYSIGGLMDCSTGLIRGLGNSMVSMIISIVGVCGIRIGWIYTIFQIPQFHTPQS